MTWKGFFGKILACSCSKFRQACSYTQKCKLFDWRGISGKHLLEMHENIMTLFVFLLRNFLFLALEKEKNSASTLHQWFCSILCPLSKQFGTRVTGRAWSIGVETVSVIVANCLSWRQKELALQNTLYSQKLFKNKPFAWETCSVNHKSGLPCLQCRHSFAAS